MFPTSVRSQGTSGTLQTGRRHFGLLSRSRPHSALHVALVEPPCVRPEVIGGIRFTVNYQQLNKVTEIPQIAIPRVDEVLDTLGGGSVFSVFDLFSGFTQLTIHPDTIPLTAFCTPNGLYEWLRILPGAAGAPAWFVRLDHETRHGRSR